jgi:uncharacterized protein YggE
MSRMIFSVAAAAVLAFASPVMAQPADTVAALSMTTLDVTGRAEIQAAPDIAHLSAGVTTQAATATAAMSDNATKMTATLAALKKAGIQDKHIQTSGLNLNPQYAYNNNEAPRITGYQAMNNVNVTILDLSSAGAVIDTLVAAGATQINGPNFTIKNPDDLLDAARAEAVAKAKKRADVYAKASGMKLKRIISISEGSSDSMPQPQYKAMRAMSAESAPTPVAQGEIGLGVAVNIRYELSP